MVCSLCLYAFVCALCPRKFHANSTHIFTQIPCSFSRMFPRPHSCDFHGTFVHLIVRKQRSGQYSERKTTWPTKYDTHTHGFTDTGTRTDNLETPCATNSYYTTNCCTDPYYYITTPYSTKDKKYMKPPSIMWNQH